MKTYLLTYLCSAVLTLMITPLIISLARAFRLYDTPDARKVHASAIPRIGGIAIFASTIALVISVLFLDNHIGETFRSIQKSYITLLIAAALVFVVGLIDDLYGVRAYHKLIAQITAAMILCLVGIRIESVNFANFFTIDFGWLSFPITICWIIAITNAINLIDGLDGLAAGISAIACGVLAIFAINNEQHVMAILMLSLFGSLSGFLFFNFNPARIFMGDSGSMFLGFIIASSSVMCTMKSGTLIAITMPALALGLPIVDMIVCVIRRYIGRWGIMSADRGHLHHRMLDMGLRHRHIVIGMYLITALTAGFGLFMMVTYTAGTIIIFFSITILLAVLFHAVGAVRPREFIAKIKTNLKISRQAKAQVNIFQNTFLMFNKAASFRELWQAISNACEKMEFSELALSLTDRNSHLHTFRWISVDQNKNRRETVHVKLHIEEHRLGMPVDIDAKIPANDSLESIGRRMMLLGRLIDEYGEINLLGKINIRIPSTIKPIRKNKPSEQLVVSQY